ncbi:glucose-6-phosphate isomerase [Rhodobacteraceae bacterium NNCM2]|nr:glucose-6-phosphate isomerase [Coraliihabitans acroporae]
MSLTEAWQSLDAHWARLKPRHLREAFASDPDRVATLSAHFEDLHIDFSKEKLDSAALSALLELARASDLASRREAMYRGDPINNTEGRAAFHVALRGSVAAPEGDDVDGTLNRFLTFAERVRSGAVCSDGVEITDVVSIGIGGSDLGPVMARHALRSLVDGPQIHYVSNVDGSHFADTVARLDPARTFVIIASKSFTTQETMANAVLAREWLGDGAEDRMAAVSSNIAGCAEFGIPAERVFGFWDWVGGRYSLWSSVGLSLAIGIGAKRYRELLAGAAAMDRHFLEAPLESNLPVLLALIGIWRRNVMGCGSVALIPYDQRLDRFPAFVQQLDMESNGKSVERCGSPVARATGPVIWGEPGTNAQHSFFQLIHQGTDVIPVDFIAAARPTAADAAHHTLLLANCLAQGQALAFGRSAEEVADEMHKAGKSEKDIAALVPHRVFPGDRPSTMILFRQLDPYSLGRLIAMFEHKVFVQGVLWGVNSFDQWGVELGKVLTNALLPAMNGDECIEMDDSTRALVATIRELGSD